MQDGLRGTGGASRRAPGYIKAADAISEDRVLEKEVGNGRGEYIASTV